MMKFLFWIVLAVICLRPATAQSPTDSIFKGPADGQITVGDPDCGNRVEESQIYEYRFGRVVEVTTDNKLVVLVTHISGDVREEQVIGESGPHGDQLAHPKKFTVSLAGIDGSRDRQTLAGFLRQRVLGREVTIEGITTSTKYRGVVQLDGDEEFFDLNSALLENGIALYAAFESGNQVSMVWPCILEKAERRAKEAKRGIWATL